MRYQALGKISVEHLPWVFALEPDRQKAVGVSPYGHFIQFSKLELRDIDSSEALANGLPFVSGQAVYRQNIRIAPSRNREALVQLTSSEN